ncbi:GvpL/GvpF family gas vesicle protein [Streptomyces sp. NPDC017993]|uniref:GvpL/GvpF family gas vesicle protein n=1 Tax=Streptomyces sp. NPDC017993 TaxID=3365027 RepID=UPI0037943F4C
MVVYVYSIVATTHPQRLDDLDGVGDQPSTLRTVRSGKLAAVVSDTPEGLRPKRRDLAAHQAVQERLMADGTLLPLQFGLTAADDDAVRAALEERAEKYTTRLRVLQGCAEYHLKATQDEESLLRQILLDSEEARGLNEEIKSGRGRPDLPVALGELIAREVRARQDKQATEVIGALGRLAREERVSQPTGADFLTVSFLVEGGRAENFVSAEKELAAELGEDFAFRLRGPLPAYSFV